MDNYQAVVNTPVQTKDINAPNLLRFYKSLYLCPTMHSPTLLLLFTSLAIALDAPSSDLSTPDSPEKRQTPLTISPGAGTNNGYYYNFWYDAGLYATGEAPEEPPIVVLQPSGRYNVEWSGNSSSFLVGKGWKPGTAR
jgi:hypothetical protein